MGSPIVAAEVKEGGSVTSPAMGTESAQEGDSALDHRGNDLKDIERSVEEDGRIVDSRPSQRFLYLLTVSSALGGFMFGYDTGVISGALVLLASPEEFDLSDEQKELVVSVTIFGAIVGAVAGGVLNSIFGRRLSILSSSLIFTFGGLWMGCSKSVGWLISGRWIVGLAVGISSMTVPVYISEISTAESRGSLVTLNNLFITGGQFIASILTGLLVDVPHGWRWMLGLSALPSLAQFILFLCLPETPRWLVLNEREEEARRVLEKVRGTADVRQEIEDIKASSNTSSNQSSYRELFLSRSFMSALYLGCILQALQQFCGINTVMYYGATILQMAGFTDEKTAIWLSAVIAFSNFLFTILGLYLVERVGRRWLTLGSLGGVSIVLFLLGGAFYLADRSSETTVGYDRCSVHKSCFGCVADTHCGFCRLSNSSGLCLAGSQQKSEAKVDCAPTEWSYFNCPDDSRAYGWTIFALLFLFLAFFAPGMGPMPWTINSEIYPLQARSLGNSVATTVNWVANLIMAFTFLSLSRYLNAYWVYCSVALVGCGYLYKYLPETKALSLEDIQALFDPNSVKRRAGQGGKSGKYEVVRVSM